MFWNNLWIKGAETQLKLVIQSNLSKNVYYMTKIYLNLFWNKMTFFLFYFIFPYLDLEKKIIQNMIAKSLVNV